MSAEAPTGLGSVVAVFEGDEAVLYIRGKHDVWYPIAIGAHPYKATCEVEAQGFTLVEG